MNQETRFDASSRPNGPDGKGHFGIYGGSFIAETLMDPVNELQIAYERYRKDNEFVAEFEWELKNFVGRPNQIGRASCRERV